MKNLRITPLLVSLPLIAAHMSCAHYDPKRPNFKKNELTEPTFDSDKKGTDVKSPVPDNAVNEGDKDKADSLPKPPLEPIPRAPNPMAGPGMEMTVPVPIVGTAPAEMPKAPEANAPATYNDALSAVDKAKEKDPNLKNFWVGAGYDMLTGNRMSVCLDPNSLRTSVTASEETTDSYSVSHDYRELYDKLETEFGADVGGIWQIFTGKLSFKTKILRETRMASDDVVVVAGFTHVRNKITLQTPASEHAPFFRTVGIRDKQAFRQYCGDKLSKEVSVGASMHLVFTAKKLDQSNHNKTDVEAAIRIGLAGILDVGANTKVSTEQKEILKSYAFTAKCYTLGASSGVCGSYSASTAFDINSDLGGFQKKVEEVRARMIQEVQGGKNLVVVRENLVDYDVPGPANEHDDELANVKRWDYFVDYRDRLAKVKRMSLDKTEAAEVCNNTPYWPRRCARVAGLFDEAVQSCLSFGSSCEIPNDNEFQTLMTAKNPGWITLWKDQNYKGSAWTIDFRDFPNSRFKPNTFYDFKGIGLGGANDQPTSLKSDLKGQWKVRFWEHGKALDRGHSYDVVGRQDYSWIDGPFEKKANDRFSAFEVIPGPDL